MRSIMSLKSSSLLEMSPSVTMAPFSASEKIHFALVVCDSEWMTVALHRAFLSIHRSGYSAVYLLHGWCRVELLPSRRTFCVRHTTLCTKLHCHFRISHIYWVHVCLAVACHLRFWQNDRDLSRVNNNNGHFYGAWSLARSRAQCAVQKAAEKCINTYNGQIKKGFRPYDRQPRKNLHTAISVNKPKLSVTKHDQTLILAHIYDTADILQI